MLTCLSRLNPDSRSLRWAAVVIWCAVIFSLSAIPHLGTGLKEDFVLRKIAHACEYAVLAILAFNAIHGAPPRDLPASANAAVAADARGLSTRQRFLQIGLAWLFTVAYATSDEWHQSFVPSRHGSPIDVMIDAGGTTIGLILFGYIAHHRVRTARRSTAS